MANKHISLTDLEVILLRQTLEQEKEALEEQIGNPAIWTTDEIRTGNRIGLIKKVLRKLEK